jgi:hypothetical protein
MFPRPQQDRDLITDPADGAGKSSNWSPFPPNPA